MLRGRLQLTGLINKNTADFLVFTNIDITVGFKTHFITMASNSYDFVTGKNCCFPNAVICEFFVSDI